jgi:hypothetical protein
MYVPNNKGGELQNRRTVINPACDNRQRVSASTWNSNVLETYRSLIFLPFAVLICSVVVGACSSTMGAATPLSRWDVNT